MKSGYYRQPSIFGDQIVFVSEDDLWRVSASGGVAHRLTATNGLIRRPCFSPDGELLAFSSFEEGALEAYVMPSSGGEVKRLTYFGAISEVFGWREDGEVLFNSAP
jgi:tricorn protease